MTQQEYREKINLERPWFKHFLSAQNRCNSKKSPYAKRGIKCFLTAEQIKLLWFRDKAYLMKQPSIDRINGLNNYELNNCRFIELNINRKQKSYYPSFERPQYRRIFDQYAKDGKFIKRWKGVKLTAQRLGILHSSICNCLSGRSKTAGGYIWKGVLL